MLRYKYHQQATAASANAGRNDQHTQPKKKQFPSRRKDHGRTCWTLGLSSFCSHSDIGSINATLPPTTFLHCRLSSHFISPIIISFFKFYFTSFRFFWGSWKKLFELRRFDSFGRQGQPRDGVEKYLIVSLQTRQSDGWIKCGRVDERDDEVKDLWWWRSSSLINPLMVFFCLSEGKREGLQRFRESHSLQSIGRLWRRAVRPADELASPMLARWTLDRCDDPSGTRRIKNKKKENERSSPFPISRRPVVQLVTVDRSCRLRATNAIIHAGGCAPPSIYPARRIQ